MNDTNEHINKIYQALMMKKTSIDRLIMCLSMFDSSKEIVKSTVRNKKKWREEVFLRLYRNDFDDETKRKIVSALERYSNKS